MKYKISKELFSFAKSSMGELIIGIAFAKFSKYLPVERVKETDKVVAFWHPKPYWQKHIVIVPKKPIKSLRDLDKSDSEYLSDVFKVAGLIVDELDWSKNGFTLLVNGGKRQEIGQLHFHLSSGTVL